MARPVVTVPDERWLGLWPDGTAPPPCSLERAARSHGPAGTLRWKLRPAAGWIAGDLETDGERLFVVTQVDDGKGESRAGEEVACAARPHHAYLTAL